MYGPVSITSIDTIDMSPPGSPAITATQNGNSVIDLSVVLPDKDADGNPITGLAGIVIGVALEGENGENPFADVTGDKIKETAEAAGGQAQEQALADSDAGTTIEASIPIIALGKKHWIASAVKDNA